MASAVSGVRAVYDNEGIDPCKCHVHYCECFINDDDYGLHQDCQKWLEMLPPPHALQAVPAQWHRRGLLSRTMGQVADAHMKRQIMGRDAQRCWL